MRLQRILLVALLARPVAAAQAPDPAPRAPGATVSGVVRDSLAHAPLAGAIVQLVAADDPARGARTAASDSLGRYALGDVPSGRYKLGFLHPLLDALGVEAPFREVRVDGARPVHADLATPSPARFRAAICGAPPAAGSGAGAVVVGVVRDARDRAPAAGVQVSAEWFELSFTTEGLVHRSPHMVATTGDDGWFALCNVPRAGTMAIVASRGADSTAVIEVAVPAEGFLRRELYLASTSSVAGVAAPNRADTFAPPSAGAAAADGRLSGTVVAAVGGQPLAGAQVRVVDGPQARANERGEWTLVGAPLGTRMLEVRAVGYYPERRAVDVVADAPSVRVALSTLKAVLDTIRVAAVGGDGDRDGFEQRRRAGVGRFLTPADIMRRQPNLASDIFRTTPGVRVVPSGGTRVFVMQGPFGRCTPVVFLEGRYIDGLAADDLDTWMRPDDIEGIEIYTDSSVPTQFRRLAGRASAEDTPCGSIVIWTR